MDYINWVVISQSERSMEGKQDGPNFGLQTADSGRPSLKLQSKRLKIGPTKKRKLDDLSPLTVHCFILLKTYVQMMLAGIEMF